MNYESLSFANNFMFAKVMRNPILCKKLLEVILNVKIEKIEYPEEEKVIDIAADAKSVRLDVYAGNGHEGAAEKESVLSSYDRPEPD
jgi:hypothetical protein